MGVKFGSEALSRRECLAIKHCVLTKTFSCSYTLIVLDRIKTTTNSCSNIVEHFGPVDGIKHVDTVWLLSETSTCLVTKQTLTVQRGL